MDPDNAPELTATPTPARKPRETGKLVWLDSPPTIALAILPDQPEHADIAAARKWLGEQIASDKLPADRAYALHRAICTVTPRVEVTRKAVL